MEDQKSLQIADAVIELLKAMQDGTVKLYIKVNLGRVKRLTAHNGIISEVYVNDETDFNTILVRMSTGPGRYRL